MVRTNLNQPCAECPFRRKAAPGWLGPWNVESLIDEVEHGAFVCHRSIGDTINKNNDQLEYCAGAAIYLNNHFKLARDRTYSSYQTLLKEIPQTIKESVFSNKNEFTEHHNSRGMTSGDLINKDNDNSNAIICSTEECMDCLMCVDMGCINCDCECGCECSRILV